jgi:hypothetical protein
MAPKKKPAKAGEGEVDTFDEFCRTHEKKRREFGTSGEPTQKIQEYYEIQSRIVDDGEEVMSWNFSREFDPMAFRVLFMALRQPGAGLAPINTIMAIRVWKCNGGDESVRSVCHYLDGVPSPTVEDLQFTDNGVTPLGCEFLGRTLGPNGNKVVNLIRLDFNQFGTEGIEKLSLGLSQNSTLRHLSLRYCGIGEEGGQYLAHILMFIRNALEVLELRGNYLKNKGIIDVFTGARRAKCLRELDVFDNKFTDTPDVIEAVKELFECNTKLDTYNLAGNQISDDGAAKLVAGMIGHGHLKAVLMTERCSLKTFEALEEVLGKSKGKKKGKKKGK